MNWMTLLMSPLLHLTSPADTTIKISMPYESLTGNYTILWVAQESRSYDVAAYNYTLNLDDVSGKFHGQACNVLRGSFSATMGKTIHFEAMASTRKFCPPDQGAPAVVHALQQADNFRFKGDMLLLLQQQQVVMKLQRQPEAPGPIDPTLETVHAMMSTAYQIAGVAAPERWVTLDSNKATFLYDAAANRVSGKAVCNNYFGSCHFSFNADGTSGTIKLGAMGTTMMACPQGMKEEQWILKALQVADRFDITDDGMELFSGQRKLLSLKTMKG